MARGHNSRKISNKLLDASKPLRIWNKAHFGITHLKISKLESKLKAIQLKEDLDTKDMGILAHRHQEVLNEL